MWIRYIQKDCERAIKLTTNRQNLEAFVSGAIVCLFTYPHDGMRDNSDEDVDSLKSLLTNYLC